MSKKKQPPQLPDRLPPYAGEVEAAILGCILLAPNECMAICLDKLTGDGDFYDLRHALIYEVMKDIYSENKVIELVTLVQRLSDRELLDRVGGPAYISTLPDFSTSTANIGQHIEEIEGKRLLRKVIQTCTDFTAAAYGDSDQSPEEVVQAFEMAALSLAPNKVETRKDIKVVVSEAMAEIERLHNRRGEIEGMNTGFTDLNKLTGGLHPGEMVVVAGYPGSGKTALAMNIVESVAIYDGIPVGVFSMEMTAKSLVMRMICSQSRVSLNNIRDGFMSEKDFPKITTSAGKISRAKIFIEDISDMSILQLRSKARRMVQEHGIKLVVIDYLQLLNAIGGPRRVESRQQEVTDISRGIKGMAKELDVPVIALSQLNDDGKLRESRAIGQDADGLWMLENEGDQVDDDGPVDARAVKLTIKKQRNGPAPAVVHLTFIKPFTRFESASKVSTEDYDPTQQQLPHND